VTKKTKNELKKKVGLPFAELKIMQHDAWDLNSMKDHGELDVGGVPIKFLANKALSEYDFKIAIGMVAPHVDAGWSGGGKLVLPGVTHESTTRRFHMAGALLLDRYDLTYFVGNIKGPLRKACDSAAEIVGLDMIVNVVLDTHQDVAGVFVGHPLKAHRRAVAFASRLYRSMFTKEADIVVVSAYPEDIDYWQAMKAEEVSFSIVRKGGTIIVLATCPDGPCPLEEHKRNLTLLGKHTFAELMVMIKEGKLIHTISAAIVLEVAMVRDKAETFIVTNGMTDKECRSYGIRRFDTLDEALRAAYGKHGRNPSVAILESSLVIPAKASQ